MQQEGQAGTYMIQQGESTETPQDPAWTALPDTPPVEIKLFVGRVPRTVDEASLRPVFEEYGAVTEIAIIKDRNTAMHKGSAFVRMASITQADAAVRALNNVKVLDPQLGALQVRYATGEAEKLGMSPESAYPGQDQAKLFVGSLPRNVTEEEVRNIFAPCGQIDEIFIMKDAASGQGKGCAFVKFGYKEQAIHAIKTISGITHLSGAPRPLEVRFAESKKNMIGTSPGQNVYGAVGQPVGQQGGMMLAASPLGVGGAGTFNHVQPFPSAVAAAQYGSAPNPQAANTNPRAAGPWKEYFTDDGRAYYHNEQTNSTQWERPADFDRQDVAGPPGANIFVFHVPNDWTQQDLISNFQHFGQIVSARIATDKATGRNKGYAFVSYVNIQSAAQAVQQMNGFMAGTKRLKVSIKQNEEMYVQHLLNQQAPAAMPGAQTSGPILGGGPVGGPMAGGPAGPMYRAINPGAYGQPGNPGEIQISSHLDVLYMFKRLTYDVFADPVGAQGYAPQQGGVPRYSNGVPSATGGGVHATSSHRYAPY